MINLFFNELDAAEQKKDVQLLSLPQRKRKEKSCKIIKHKTYFNGLRCTNSFVSLEPICSYVELLKMVGINRLV